MSMLRPILSRGRVHLQPYHLRGFATAIDPSISRNNQQQHQANGNKVKIVEVGPRDGLQNEGKVIPLTTKIELIERLAKTGLTDIEAGSFVAPKWVPQMADSNEILEYILRNNPTSLDPINYSFLVPNVRGLENATSILQQHLSSYKSDAPPTSPPSPKNEELSALDTSNNPNAMPGIPKTNGSSSTSAFNPFIEISVFAAATESFTQKNLNCNIATSLERFKEVIQGAKAAGLRVRAYISVVLGCPFEGYDTDPRKVAEIATDLLEMGADEIDLGDTTGMGTAPRTSELLRAMQAAGIRNEDIAMHFHDTYGQALVNTAVSLEHGIRTFDSSVGGLGGCPYSPGATGNVGTEDLVYFLESLGMDHGGINLDAVADIGAWITGEVGKPNASRVGKALLGRRHRKL